MDIATQGPWISRVRRAEIEGHGQQQSLRKDRQGKGMTVEGLADEEEEERDDGGEPGVAKEKERMEAAT